jgi:hypothetical protein
MEINEEDNAKASRAQFFEWSPYFCVCVCVFEIGVGVQDSLTHVSREQDSACAFLQRPAIHFYERFCVPGQSIRITLKVSFTA